MSIGNANKPIDQLDFPAITLCGPGSNLDELAMVPDLKPNEWTQFWQNYNAEIDKNITDMNEMKEVLINSFAQNQIEGWPDDLNVDTFLAAMTTFYPALIRRNILMKLKEANNSSITYKRHYFS